MIFPSTQQHFEISFLIWGCTPGLRTKCGLPFAPVGGGVAYKIRGRRVSDGHPNCISLLFSICTSASRASLDHQRCARDSSCWRTLVWASVGYAEQARHKQNNCSWQLIRNVLADPDESTAGKNVYYFYSVTTLGPLFCSFFGRVFITKLEECACPKGQYVGQMSEGSGHLRRLYLYKYDRFPPVFISTTFFLKELSFYAQVSDALSLPSVSRYSGSDLTYCGEF